MPQVVGLVGLAAFVVAVRSRLAALRRIEVRGESMTPTLRPGDVVVVDRRRRPRVGAVVAVESGPRVHLKRVAALDPAGRLVLLGDNRVLSTDARHGLVADASQVCGVVVGRSGPRGRRGRLR